MTTFWKHQQEAFDFIEPKTAALVAMGMGCGKSFVAVSFIDHLKCSRVIILCPPTVRGVWRREFAKHSTRNAKVVILENGNVKKRTKQAREACKCGGPVVVVINYEAAWREPFRSWALAREWDLALLDESQRAQYESKTALFCNALRGVSKRRLCLTGTPLTQDAMSVWAQCRFLDPSVFGENVEWFKDRYHNQYAVRERKELAKLQAIRKMVGKP
ncbi:MAG TPA: SNF2-related protein, partial [Anaerolineae bacterium]|nr:SNF2-related protein [Anaerolineae bacterium]